MKLAKNKTKRLHLNIRERDKTREKEKERDKWSNVEKDRKYRVRRQNVARYKATWRARLHWQEANVRTVGRTEHAGYTRASEREVKSK